jgi:hypothetical protein
VKAYEPNKPLVLIGQPYGNYPFFRDVMFQWFGKKFLDLSDRPAEQMMPWSSKSIQPDGCWAPEIDCVGGIFDAGSGNCVHRCCPDDSQWILLVADPFATAVKSYYVAKAESDAGRFWLGGTKTHVDVHFRSIDEYLERFPRSIYDHLPTDLTLDNFRQRFSQRYIYVGAAEDPLRSSRNLADVISQPVKSLSDLPISNQDESLPEHLRRRFEHNFPLPNQIHQFAKESAAA